MTPVFILSRPAACFVLGVALLLTATLGAQAAEVRKILLLHSYGRDTAPYGSFVASFRAEMLRTWPAEAAFYDFSLESGRAEATADDGAVCQVLRDRFAHQKLDLVVTIGAAAVGFYARNRDALFASVPVLQIIEERVASTATLRRGDAIVGTNASATEAYHDILQLLPNTESIAVIHGSSTGERFWAAESRRSAEPFQERVKFVWLDELRLSELRERLAALRPGTVVFYGSFQVDGAGTTYEQDYALKELYAASSVPMFGFFESQIGEGLVGGRVISTAEQGVVAANTAGHMLKGEPVPQAVTYIGPTLPQFDWRELQRWKIDEKRLPSGSIVRFRPLSIWQEHQSALIAGFGVLLLQAALIMALIMQARARSRAERESFALSWRLLTAHEDERRRLARELHDDVNQRLARLAIDAARLEALEGRANDRSIPSVHGGLVDLSEDVHALSYRLHPSILDDLGLAEALKAECEHVSRSEPVTVDVQLDAVPEELPNDVALCIFRVAQEALRNVARHANASLAIVSVTFKDDGLQLAVRDNGVGFDMSAKQERHSLGRAGMGERVRLLGGDFTIMSAFGQGTTVSAWVPVKGVSS